MSILAIHIAKISMSGIAIISMVHSYSRHCDMINSFFSNSSATCYNLYRSAWLVCIIQVKCCNFLFSLLFLWPHIAQSKSLFSGYFVTCWQMTSEDDNFKHDVGEPSIVGEPRIVDDSEPRIVGEPSIVCEPSIVGEFCIFYIWWQIFSVYTQSSHQVGIILKEFVSEWYACVGLVVVSANCATGFQIFVSQ